MNEMEDCGAVYRQHGKPVDPFALLKEEGGNIVRVRIWVNADLDEIQQLSPTC